MTLDAWYEETLENLHRFVNWWKKNHEQNPADYPMELGYGDWSEQFDLEWEW
jgi:hypothetical protein